MNYDNIQTVNASPYASSMVESFRAMGYSIETAIADIIDNSISAGAQSIWINRIWDGGKSIITIKDDGCGMNNDDIVNAMRPGTQNPLDTRSRTDLGRFGLGLKTASFSQCRKLTVYSKKKDYASTYWSWDLDYVAQSNEWNLIKWMPEEFESELDDLEHGTLIIWSSLDRIVGANVLKEDNASKVKFSNALDIVRRHVAMTFHRFIEDRNIKIFWCGHEIEPWNPFCAQEPKTQAMPMDSMPGEISIKGYVLPHKSAFSSEHAYNEAEGINGWPAQQGFYVYRGKRLLLAGDWLGLFRKEEHYKLARIQVDLPNTLDSEWQIDIKKSRAYPPAQCREQLISYAKRVRSTAEEVYRHRGKILKQRAGTSFQPLWLEKSRDGHWSFVINREHDMIKTLQSMAKENPNKAMNLLMKFIEETLPTKTIYIKEAQGEEKEKEPFTGQDISWVSEIIKRMYETQLSCGMTTDQAKSYIKTIEPFDKLEYLIDNL